MTKIDERVQRALKEFAPTGQQALDLARLKEFYEAKKVEGVAVQSSYELPPVDTIGRRITWKRQQDRDESQHGIRPQPSASAT